MGRITHFEIPSDDPEKAMEFYKNVFGWTYHKFGDQPYWFTVTGPKETPGIDGGIMQKRDPEQPVVCSVNVKDIDRSIEAVVKNGGLIVVPKTPIPGVGWLAYFRDLDDHIFGIMQDDHEAK